MKSTSNDDDHFPSCAPENVTDNNISIYSSSPLTIMPELLVDVGIESTETEYQSIHSFFCKKRWHTSDKRYAKWKEKKCNLKTERDNRNYWNLSSSS